MKLYRPTSPPSHSNTPLPFPRSGPSLWSFPFCLQLFCLLFTVLLYYLTSLPGQALILAWQKSVGLKSYAFLSRHSFLPLPQPKIQGPYMFVGQIPQQQNHNDKTALWVVWAGWYAQPHAWGSAYNPMSTSPYFRPWMQPFHAPSAKTHLISLEVGTAYSSWLQSLPLSYHNLCPK